MAEEDPLFRGSAPLGDEVSRGLVDAERVLKRVKGIAVTRFTSADVVRHPLVARIVDAYDTADRPAAVRPALSARS